MCGFVGFVSKINNKKKIIKDMADIIVHRGPDSDGYYIDDNGVKRYGIIPKQNSNIINGSIEESYVNLGIRTSNPIEYYGYL